VNGEEPVISIRTLILLIISLKRWKGLPGLPTSYAGDTRHWWWLQNNSVSPEQIVERIHYLSEELTESKEDNKILKRTSEQARAELEQVREESEETVRAFQIETEKVPKLQRQLADLSKALEAKIDPEDFGRLNDKLVRTKEKLKLAKQQSRDY
jgi:uncharacterized membrane protein YccC